MAAHSAQNGETVLVENSESRRIAAGAGDLGRLFLRRECELCAVPAPSVWKAIIYDVHAVPAPSVWKAIFYDVHAVLAPDHVHPVKRVSED